MDLNLEHALEHATQLRPCHGFEVGGDTCIIESQEQGLFVAIVDVLGHGPDAHELTHEIEGFLEHRGTDDVAQLMINLHQRLRGSRGAAVGMCFLDANAGTAIYTGVGNTVCRRFGKADTRLVSQDGVLGQNMRTPNVQTLALEDGDLVLLHTDGIKNRFAEDDYAGLLSDSPKDVSATVIQRFSKSYDDAACIAVRYRK